MSRNLNSTAIGKSKKSFSTYLKEKIDLDDDSLQSAKSKFEDLKGEYQAKLDETVGKLNKSIRDTRNKYRDQLNMAKTQFKEQIEEQKSAAAAELRDKRTKHRNEIKMIKSNYDDRIEKRDMVIRHLHKMQGILINRINLYKKFQQNLNKELDRLNV